MALRVLVTRPQPQADDWVQRLRGAGLEACALPLIEIASAGDMQALHQAWAALPRDDIAVFVSPNAVARFLAAAPPPGWPAKVLAACTGPGTAGALRAHGVPPAQVVEPPADAAQFDSEALWSTRLAAQGWRGRSVLIVRGDGGRDWLADTFTAHGASVRFVQAYTRACPALDGVARGRLDDALARLREHVWLFSSSQAIENLATLAPGTDWRDARAVATHPRIAASARALGMCDVHETSPTEGGVIAALSALSTGAART